MKQSQSTRCPEEEEEEEEEEDINALKKERTLSRGATGPDSYSRLTSKK
jgi:hypothetical protein